MKPLRIIQLLPPWIQTPPVGYGGVEYVVSLLTEELVRRGHSVRMIAAAGSKTHAKLVSTWTKPVYKLDSFWSAVNNPTMAKYWLPSLFALGHVTQGLRGLKADIVHNHFHWFGILLSTFLDLPMVTTWHGNFGNSEPVEVDLFKRYPRHPFVSISQRQQATDKVGLRFMDTIYHGVPVHQFEFSPTPGKYLTWLGRITAKKGVEEAIDFARKAKKPIKIAGIVNPVDEAYFKQRIKPKIDGKQVQYVGPVNFKQKTALLSKAEALIYPLKWDEPFGLVLLESMACGTPVVAYPLGAAPEIVEPGRSGFLPKTKIDFLRDIKRISTLDRAQARKRAEQFSVEHMAEMYEQVYYKLVR